VDITQLILDDHHEQRRLFAILDDVDRGDTGTLAAVWARLSAFLEVHAAAEEEIFYPELLRVGIRTGSVGSAEAETLDAIHDHNDIRDAIAAVPGHQVGSGEWFAAIAAVNVANGDHMAEEEREGLTDFRRYAGLELRHRLAVAFAAFEARHFAGVPPVDKDPQVYVRQAERDIAVPGSAGGGPAGRGGPDGSLGIGSLGKRPG
jgi:Hemerythrin HHE cation binding domain